MDAQLEQLCAILRQAGKDEVMSRFLKVSHHRKEDGSLITETDLAVQERINNELESRWPGWPMLGEEMGRAQQKEMLQQADKALWCLDPLDGTNNYAGGFPFFSLSLALIEDRQPTLGVVYDPIRDECFAARRGAGAWLNGKPLRWDGENYELRDCLAVVDIKRLPAPTLTRLATEAPYRSHRNLGSIALEWCWLAAGRFQLYLQGGQMLWDYAAGRLILQEAEGASRLLAIGRKAPREGLSLSPCLFAAAVNQELFSAWDRWVSSWS